MGVFDFNFIYPKSDSPAGPEYVADWEWPEVGLVKDSDGEEREERGEEMEWKEGAERGCGKREWG